MWVVTVHNGGGSAGEAVEPQFAVAFPDEALAKEFAERLTTAFERFNDYWWAQHFEVPSYTQVDWPKANAASVAELERELGRKQKPNEVAIDLETLAEMLIDYETPEILPPPPSRDEEEAAKQSILQSLGTEPGEGD